MASYRELVQQARSEIDEIPAAEAARLLEGGDPPAMVDVRERDEWDEGHIPGAVHIPRGFLESRIETTFPDRDQPLVIYCQSGARSALATKTLDELGYTSVVNLVGGFTD